MPCPRVPKLRSSVLPIAGQCNRLIFMDEPYHFFAFDNPLEALSAIEAKEFAVVVTDQSMSELDGIK